MAGPLTWRDVAAPNFAPAMQGYQMFSDLLNNAFSSAERGLAKYDGQRNDAANRVAMFNAMTEQDPEALKAKLADGSLFNGVDLARLSPETIAAADSRVGTLINRSAAEENLDQTRINNTRTNKDNAQRDTAKLAIAKILEARDSGDPAKLAAAQAQYGEAARSVPYQDLLPNAAAFEGLETSDLAQRGTSQNIDQSAITFAQQQKDRADKRAAIDYLAKVGPSTAGDPELLLSTITSSDLPQGVRTQLFKILGPDRYLGAGGGGGSGGSGGDNFSMSAPQQEVVARFRNSSMSDPVIAGFLGNFHVEGGYGGAEGDGGSAGGIAQWRGQRRTNFQKRYGVDPTKATATQQADYVIWELTTPEGRKSAGISNKNARAILDAKTPQQAAALIDQYYEISSGAHRNRRISAADAASRYLSGSENPAINPAMGDANRITAMRNDINGVATDFNAGWNADTKSPAIAQELTKKGGMIEGADRVQLQGMIENIKQTANVNDAVAGNILARSLKRYVAPSAGNLWGAGETLYSQLGTSGYTVDADKMKWYMGQFRNNGVLRTQDRANRLAIAQQQLPVVQQQLDALIAKEQTIAKQGGDTKEARENFNRVRAQREALQRQRDALRTETVSRERALRDSLDYKPQDNTLFSIRPIGSRGAKPKGPRDDEAWYKNIFTVRRADDK